MRSTLSTLTRITLAAVLLLAAFGVWANGSGWLPVPAQAGVEAAVTVNSTGNTDDGDCEGPPNDNVLGGDCTLYEAINAANNGVADVINFHPAVFPIGNPRTITVDSADMAAPDGVENPESGLPAKSGHRPHAPGPGTPGRFGRARPRPSPGRGTPGSAGRAPSI